jgi:hypothetical protein
VIITAVLIAAALGFSGLILWQVRRSHAMRNALPVPIKATLRDIRTLYTQGVDLVAILGTGSMRPTIPAGAGVVAYAQLDRRAYVLLGPGDLVVFRVAGGGYVVHQLAQLDGGSWITGGSANARYDAARMDATSYVGLVVKIHLLTPSA